MGRKRRIVSEVNQRVFIFLFRNQRFTVTALKFWNTKREDSFKHVEKMRTGTSMHGKNQERRSLTGGKKEERTIRGKLRSGSKTNIGSRQPKPKFLISASTFW